MRQSIVESKLTAERTASAPRAVFVGGSSVLFGVDPSGLPSIKNILDLLLPYLNKGDLVVLHWEYEHYGFTRSGCRLAYHGQASFKDQLPWLDRRLISPCQPFLNSRWRLKRGSILM